MRMKRLTMSAAAVLGGLWILAGVGCEDTDPVAGTDSTIELFANPATITVGEGQQGESVITAIVVNANGIGQAGVGVRFSTTSGSLASGGSLRTTNAQGEASDTLTTGSDATVTARSGNIVATVDVLVDVNPAPFAIIDASPPFQAPVGTAVQFSGALSEGDITEYRWAIVSNAPDPGAPNPDTQTTSQPTITRTYNQPQALDVTLEVKDSFGLTDRTTDFYDIVAAP